ncbi:MAG TPA: tubulin-like doman-containing protein [Gemmataceae bacterium]|nr:tubulin-like doman-containing protein [Gemmataceae bacterium]
MAVRIENQAEPIPGYRLIERIGGGGFGDVWKCEAPGGLLKAIKFVFGDLGAAGDDGHRAEQELKALSRVKTVRHPYILSLERYDIIDGQLMIVMELADKNLWDRFKECRARGLPGIPRQELLGYMEESAEALDLMNSEYQLQHLDIKPQNIFLVHQHIKVADFGLVKDLEGMQASVTGGVTPVYAAPETFDGWVSRFCDQYSLAIVYQELLVGQRPFAGTNVRQLILQHLQAVPNVSPLPPGDQQPIARALSKTPGDRFPTCRDLVESLKAGGGAGGVSTLSGTQGADAPRSESTSEAIAPSQVSGLSTPAGGLTDRKDDAGPLSDPNTATASLRPTRHPDSNPGTTQFIRSLEAATLQPGGIGEPRKAPPEVNGEGVLLPALVIGLGQLGMTVVQRLRHHLHTRFGGMDRLPHLHLMVLDTDPEVVRAATRGAHGARLSETDVVLAPLNRPSHYLKPRDGRPDVESWLNPRMLYRIPRSQMTTGVRALGRLAFCDNYRLIVRRLQTELNACLDPDALASALRQTGLGLRTNRVRVYVITSLAGGTGSGMFVDLAYTVRALLKQAGYSQPDVVGLFLLPSVDRNRTRTLTLGNACAALRELSHFARPGSTFMAKYHQREAAIQDSDPPFSRCIMLPLPEETDEVSTRELVELAGLFLSRDLCSPLGRIADLGRGGLAAAPWESRGLYYQTFGLYPLSWPRRTVLRSVARRMCQRLIQRWMSKDSKPIRESVRTWVQEQWTQQELGSSVLMERLGEMSRETLGQDPDDAFRALVDPLLERHTVPHKGRKGTAVEVDLPPEELAEVLEQFEQLLGKPQDDGLTETPARLAGALREAADKLVQSWGQKLAELPVRLIEEPQFRLAGAEEVIRQMVASIEQALQHHEPLSRELTTRAAEAYSRLQMLIANPQRPQGRSTTVQRAGKETVELLRGYPKTLYQSLLLRQAGNVFLTLRGHLADEMREINFCRVRLGELLRMLDEPAESAEPSPASGTLGKHLFPAGCKDLKEAIEFIEGRLGTEALNDLDARMEAMFKKQFTALVNVCLTSANVLKNVESAMLHTAEEFIAGHLGDLNVAEMFLENHPDAQQAADEISSFFDESAPELSSSSFLSPNGEKVSAELCVLATPSGPAGDHFHDLAVQALPDVEWHSAPGDEDIVLYRELANLPLSDLPQVGPLGQDAYRQMSAAEHFTPHCRGDVDFSKS